MSFSFALYRKGIIIELNSQLKNKPRPRFTSVTIFFFIIHAFETIMVKSNIMSFKIKERSSCFKSILKAKQELVASFEVLRNTRKLVRLFRKMLSVFHYQAGKITAIDVP